MEVAALQQVEENPGTSTRRVAANLGTSHKTVWKVFNEQLLHPFKLQKVQALNPGDFPHRLQYCQWLRARVNENQNFLATILSTDEKGFAREGTFNAFNSHVWADENPHAMHFRGYQQKFRLNVWAGIIGNHLVGPVILPGNLNGPGYLHFLQTTLEDLLDELPVARLQNMWYQQDGCPAHWALIVRAHLDQRFPGHWIGRGGPVAWPARSADLTPPDFFLWGAMEKMVYETPVEDVDDLAARIVLAGEEIRNDPDVFERMRVNWLSRIDQCIVQEGGHIEQLL